MNVKIKIVERFWRKKTHFPPKCNRLTAKFSGAMVKSRRECNDIFKYFLKENNCQLELYAQQKYVLRIRTK